jgi:hypothetical protein
MFSRAPSVISLPALWSNIAAYMYSKPFTSH